MTVRVSGGKRKKIITILLKNFIKLYKSISEKSKILSDLWNTSEYDTQCIFI